MILASSRSRIAINRAVSLTISCSQSSQAFPNPTIKGTGSVPERMPRSCPPPSICAVMRTRGFFFLT